MKVEATSLPGVIRIIPLRHDDARGYFMETWQAKKFAAGGIDASFVQENFSHSVSGTLRGLHYQVEKPQGRLVRVVQGEVFDVSVDLRRSSPNFRNRRIPVPVHRVLRAGARPLDPLGRPRYRHRLAAGGWHTARPVGQGRIGALVQGRRELRLRAESARRAKPEAVGTRRLRHLSRSWHDYLYNHAA